MPKTPSANPGLSAVPAQATPDRPRLRSGSIGVPGVLFLLVAGMAPLSTVASNLSLSLAFGAGEGTLAWILAMGLLLAAFTVGFVVLSRHVVNAGAYYAYIGYGLGRPAGSGAAFVAVLVYNLAAAGFVAAAGYFADIAVATYLHVDIHWFVYSAVALLAVAVLGHRGINIAAKVTAAASILQFVFLGALAVAVLVRTPERFNLDGFTAGSMFSGNYALSLVFVFLCFAGYEAAANYAEEAKAPQRVVKRATYAVLALLVGVFLISTWAVLAAFADPVAQAQLDPGTLVLRAADANLGSWAGALIVSSLGFTFLAAAVTFHSIAARYKFALARAGLLPKGLGKVHPRFGSPFVASGVQNAVNLVVLVPFVVFGLDPLVQLFPIVGGVNSLAIVALMLALSLSVVVASFRGRLADASWWSGRVIPLATAVGFAVVIGVIVGHYAEVVGSDSRLVTFMPALPLVAAIYGAVVQYRRRNAVLEEHLAAGGTEVGSRPAHTVGSAQDGIR